MRKVRAGALVLAACVAASAAAGAARAQWQFSERPSVQLGVRDKYGEVGGYEATFVVSGPKGARYEKSVRVEGDEWGVVAFPDDFPAALGASPRGEFTWACNVGGKPVTGGRFVLATTDSMPAGKRRPRPRG